MTRARATATRWRSPPESSAGLWFIRSLHLDPFEGPPGLLLALRLLRPGVDEGQLDVAEGRGAGQEVEDLEDEADLAVPGEGQLVLGHGADELAVEAVECRRSAYRGSR